MVAYSLTFLPIVGLPYYQATLLSVLTLEGCPIIGLPGWRCLPDAPNLSPAGKCAPPQTSVLVGPLPHLKPTAASIRRWDDSRGRGTELARPPGPAQRPPDLCVERRLERRESSPKGREGWGAARTSARDPRGREPFFLQRISTMTTRDF